MLTSYPVTCPHENCGWTGSLLPSVVRGGESSEVASMQRAWFQCLRCGRDWEVRITNDRVTVAPVASGYPGRAESAIFAKESQFSLEKGGKA